MKEHGKQMKKDDFPQQCLAYTLDAIFFLFQYFLLKPSIFPIERGDKPEVTVIELIFFQLYLYISVSLHIFER